MKIGIVLSGGGIRGISHLGVLKALKDKNIPISEISGTSAGSIAGALFANDVDPYDALKIFQSTRFTRLLTLALGKPAILNLESATKLFINYLDHNTFEGLRIPLTVTATNFNTGQLAYFKSGSLINKMLASCCIPGVFNPISIDGTYYIDGGVLNNFPVEPLINKCDIIIGSSCNHLSPQLKPRNMRHVLERSITLSLNHDLQRKYKFIDLLIAPENLGETGVFDITKAEEIYWIAYEQTLKKLKEVDIYNILNK